MSDSSVPVSPSTITPQEAWTKLCGMYLMAARDQLKHSVVCVAPIATLQFRRNKRGQCKFRVVCACGAQHEVPSEPDWAGAWEMITKPKLHVV